MLINKEAFRYGSAAYNCGHHYDTGPYKDHEKEYVSWLAGWRSAESMHLYLGMDSIGNIDTSLAASQGRVSWLHGHSPEDNPYPINGTKYNSWEYGYAMSYVQFSEFAERNLFVYTCAVPEEKE